MVKTVFLSSIIWFLTAHPLHANTETANSGTSPESVRSHKKLNFGLHGHAENVGLCNYELGANIFKSGQDYNQRTNPGVNPAAYTRTLTDKVAYGVNGSAEISFIGMYCSMNDKKLIWGDLDKIDLAVGRLNTNQIGSTWVLVDLESGLGFMTNTNERYQFGMNSMFLRIAFDKSYPDAQLKGRFNSYTKFRFRYERILAELSLEAPGAGFLTGIIRKPTIFDVSGKWLAEKKEDTIFFNHYIGLNLEFGKFANTYFDGSSNRRNLLRLSIMYGWTF
jgi:hypothetical protein